MERPGEPRNLRSNRGRTDQTIQTLIAALLLGTTSGCATFDVDHQSTPVFNARASARPVTVVYVQRGDTLQTVARRFGLSAQAVIDANGLRSPFQVFEGQRLVLPPSAIHVVAYGDTVSSIARSYGVPREAIVGANDLATPDNLQPGQRIAVPYVGPAPRAVSRAVQPVRTVELAAPARPVRVVVEKPVAEETGPDPRLDGARFYALGRPRAKPVLDGQGGPEEFEPPKHGPVVDADAAYDPDPVETKSASYDRSAKSSPGKFIWPVQGKVISSFGRRTSGLHNDGINIAAEPGTKVLAADDGIVVYAGNELTSYGNLLLLRHPSGYVTAYAHNKKILVKAGASVKQGDAVAIVGSTGNVDRPQLHFEIRKGERAVDPYRFLSRATASR